MQTFQYQKAKDVNDALTNFKAKKKFLAGGTTLIDLMKLEVETPQVLMDVNRLPWNKIEEKNGIWNIGATVTNSELAHNSDIQKNFPVLSQAILSGASTQLRNKATTAGNLLQRTRCVYFRDATKPCNKRQPGSGCSAIDGFNRNLAILGTSEQCIATNPSDMNVALAALEAKVQLQSSEGSREIDIADFHLLPGKTPHIETALKENELVSGVSLVKLPAGTKSLYLKLRDRASYEFALSSIAISATMNGGTISRVRFAMGGIGTKPWRVPAAEKMLEGSAASEQKFEAVAKEFLKEARGYKENKFKIELARRCLIRGLKLATNGRIS